MDKVTPDTKIRLGENTVRSFSSLEEWKEAVKSNGHRVKTGETDGQEEYFAEKVNDEDVTMIGYFRDDWGMLV